MKEKCDYKLRAGVILHIAGSSEVYTNDNLTNAVAEQFLKDNPNAQGRFAVIPQVQVAPKPQAKAGKPKRKRK